MRRSHSRLVVVTADGDIVRRCRLQSVALNAARDAADERPDRDVFIYRPDDDGDLYVVAATEVARVRLDSASGHREVRWF